MTTVDIWEIYGPRQDTDAAVIRAMERRLHDAERDQAEVRRHWENALSAIRAAGFRLMEWEHPPRLERLEAEKNA